MSSTEVGRLILRSALLRQSAHPEVSSTYELHRGRLAHPEVSSIEAGKIISMLDLYTSSTKLGRHRDTCLLNDVRTTRTTIPKATSGTYDINTSFSASKKSAMITRCQVGTVADVTWKGQVA
ncbi:Hypothetical predicted protein [Olea europaea subsp. europaea]|uniref:Uncharacterized protein n=1 Tax=Olea europaea subsp. europaea TaxID=158383 RepID=A0A8S0ST95_OLEEU|nr:Hypothetical predicted protein [Olea europaea subsp. europaea]